MLRAMLSMRRARWGLTSAVPPARQSDQFARSEAASTVARVRETRTRLQTESFASAAAWQSWTAGQFGQQGALGAGGLKCLAGINSSRWSHTHAASSSDASSTLAVPEAALPAARMLRKYSSHIKMDSSLLSELRKDPVQHADTDAMLDSIIKACPRSAWHRLHACLPAMNV
eukprot:364557-Chlamydomonas_euryale.AAC.10